MCVSWLFTISKEPQIWDQSLAQHKHLIKEILMRHVYMVSADLYMMLKSIFRLKKSEPGITWEMEAGGPGVWGHPWLHREVSLGYVKTLSQTKSN